ncbi:MAG: DNA double-strand break repair nuclease NurA [SAR202 cluster bacterium]|nr:DNA double-strand break repair nuclease NurA [SAR202 cluster bacterium]
MSLDLPKISGTLARSMSSYTSNKKLQIDNLKSIIEFANTVNSQTAIDSTKYSNTRPYLKAEVADKLIGAYKTPPTPDSWNVISTDGSHIDIDRHLPVPCSLINTGTCYISYGKKPEANLINEPSLKLHQEEMYISNPNNPNESELLTGNLLSIERAIVEIKTLLEQVKLVDNGLPTLALVDGSLILWGLSGQTYKSYVIEHFVKLGLINTLEELRQLSLTSKITMAAYISMPRSTEVINAIRATSCPQTSEFCGERCNSHHSQSLPCSNTNGLLDKDLFDVFLKSGERSPIYKSQSSIPMMHYGNHHTYFYYLHAGNEIARIEIPEWIATNPELLNLNHSIIYDQCKRGQGYPVSISEAHEQAVLSGRDREIFKDLVIQLALQNNLDTRSSQKDRSKQTPWL